MPKSRKIRPTPSFGGLRSSKVIDVDKKPLTSACHNVQHVCTYLQPFPRFHTERANSGKITFFRGFTSLWRPRSRGTPSSKGTKFCHKKLELLWQPTAKILRL